MGWNKGESEMKGRGYFYKGKWKEMVLRNEEGEKALGKERSWRDNAKGEN